MRNLVPGEKGSRSLQSRLTRVLDHEIDALITYFLLFFRGPYCFTVFRACSESFSPPPDKMILGIFENAVLLLYAIIFIRFYDSCHIWPGHMYSTVGPLWHLAFLDMFPVLKGNFPPCQCGVFPCIAQGSLLLVVSLWCSRCSAELLRRCWFRNLFLTSKQLLRWEHTGIHQGLRMILFSCHHHSSASKQKEPHKIHITICHVTNWKTLKDWKTSIQEQNPSVPARTCHYRLQLRNFQWLSWGWCRPRPKILTHPTSS